MVGKQTLTPVSNLFVQFTFDTRLNEVAGKRRLQSYIVVVSVACAKLVSFHNTGNP